MLGFAAIQKKPRRKEKKKKPLVQVCVNHSCTSQPVCNIVSLTAKCIPILVTLKWKQRIIGANCILTPEYQAVVLRGTLPKQGLVWASRRQGPCVMESVPASWKMSKCRTETRKAKQRRGESKLGTPWFWLERVAWSVGKTEVWRSTEVGSEPDCYPALTIRHEVCEMGTVPTGHSGDGESQSVLMIQERSTLRSPMNTEWANTKPLLLVGNAGLGSCKSLVTTFVNQSAQSLIWCVSA